MQGVVGCLVTNSLQIYQGIFQWKSWKSVKIWQHYGHESVASHLFAPAPLRDISQPDYQCVTAKQRRQKVGAINIWTALLKTTLSDTRQTEHVTKHSMQTMQDIYVR